MKDPFDPLSLYSSSSASRLAADCLEVQRHLRDLDPVGHSLAAAAGSLGSTLSNDYFERYMDVLGMSNPVRHAMVDAIEDARQDFLKVVGPYPDLKHLAGVQAAVQALVDDISVRSIFPGVIGEIADWDKRFGQSVLGVSADLVSSNSIAARALEELQNQSLPYLTAGSLSDTLLANLGIHDVDAYATQLRGILGGIDLDVWKERAWDLGESFASDLMDSEDDGDAPTVEQLRGAIDPDQFRAFREQFEAVVFKAVQKAMVDPKSGSKRVRWILGVFLWPLLVGLVQVICQPLFQRWLEQGDPVAATQRKPVRPSLQPQASGLVVVLSNGLNLRAGPSTTQRVVVVIRLGQTLRVLKRKHTWALVSYVDPLANGVSYTGWVKTKYIRSLEQEALNLIVENLMRMSGDSGGSLDVSEGPPGDS